jgi:hypothetical protein
VARSAAPDKIAAAQTPRAGKLNLDHVAHFVPEIDNAAAALEKLGFTLTPFSAQAQRPAPGAALVPAGSGNRCVMLKRGYIECLTPTGDTQTADQLRAAIARYVGVHLVAFGTAAPGLDHARLAEHGYTPLPPVALERQLSTPRGEDTARFTVVRVPPAVMPEGRIQFCQHHTPQLLWQQRWLTHANRATALTAVMLCVEDPAATAARYARFTGLTAAGANANWHLDTARGRILFTTAASLKRVFNTDAPRLPWIAGYVLATDNLSETREHAAAAGYAHGDLDRQRQFVVPPSSVGGIIVFESAASRPLELGPQA